MMNSGLLNDRLISVLNKYSLPGQQVGKDLETISKNAESQELIIPVLGVQGVGKSTLINAILRDDIMPSEADETTCAPVEVKFGTEEKAEVFIAEDSSPITIHTKQELYNYVDNNENPGNEKRVSRIVLYRNNELLKEGLTIVDLPGVASLTRENEETTRSYVLNLCTALFVIQGAIRRTDAMFIKSVWAQFPTAFFVQNRWAADSDLEIKEIVPYNELRLKQIADDLNNPFDGHVIVVNAYDGITGTIKNDSHMLESSNITELYDRLKLFSQNWRDSFEKAIFLKYTDCLLFTKKRILEKISDIEKTEEKKVQEMAQKVEEYNEETKRIDILLSEIKDELSIKRKNTIQTITLKTKEYGGRIRAEIHRIIDKGITDGHQLSEAFTHIQEEQGEILFEEVFTIITQLKLDLEEKVERFGQVIDFDESFGPAYASFDKKEALKYEKGLKVVLDIAGSYGGYVAAGATSTAVTAAIAAGVKAGTISAEIGAFAGPIGVAAGILTGVAIGFATYFITKSAKNVIVNKRGAVTKREIDTPIAESETSIKKYLIDKTEDFFEKAIIALEGIKKMRQSQHESLIQDLEMSQVKPIQLDELENDLLFISSLTQETVK